MPSGGDALQRLIDVREIEQLLFEYCRCADANDPDGLARCFTEDCIANYAPGPASVGADARRKQASRDLRMFTATSHHLSNIRVDHLDDNRARAESVVFAWHRPLDKPGVWELFGRYVDVVVRTPDGWKIAERTLLRVATDGFPTEWEWLEFERREGRRDEAANPAPKAPEPSGPARGNGAPSVTTHRDGPLLTITIDRPDVRNAYDLDVAQRVSAALDHFEADDELLVAVLHGAGGVFSSGMDLKKFLDGEIPATAEHGLLGLVARPRTKPLIAAVDGYAIAAGFEVALACDLIVAARDAYFALPEVKRGLVPAGGALRNLPKRIPLAVAAELALTGRPLPAERAYELGLVVRLADPGNSRTKALELAEEIAANAPGAVRAIHAVINAQADWGEAEFWERQRAIVASNLSGPDAVEGATAFLERRPPRWTVDSERT
jgi:enoyl-CoA hydratase